MSEIIHSNYTISAWLTDLSPHSRPINDQSKIIGNLVVNVFPRFVLVALTSVLCFIAGSCKCLVGAKVALTLSAIFSVSAS